MIKLKNLLEEDLRDWFGKGGKGGVGGGGRHDAPRFIDDRFAAQGIGGVRVASVAVVGIDIILQVTE